MVRAGDLVDGEFVCDLGLLPMMLHQLHFAQPHVIYAGGLEVAGISSDIKTAQRRAA